MEQNIKRKYMKKTKLYIFFFAISNSVTLVSHRTYEIDQIQLKIISTDRNDK